jgi:hypothetical protein
MGDLAESAAPLGAATASAKTKLERVLWFMDSPFLARHLTRNVASPRGSDSLAPWTHFADPP